jgi:predicted nucleic acid-binding protein
MTLVVVDTSVWQRRLQPEVGDPLGDALEADAVAMVDPIELELLRSAWGSEDHGQIREEYGALHRIPLDAEIGARAVEVQSRLARRGYHRGPSVTDLLAAAAAESAGAELWHCDRHFELIAEVTGQPVRRVGR